MFPTIVLVLLRFYDWNTLKIWHLLCMLLSLVLHCILHVPKQIMRTTFRSEVTTLVSIDDIAVWLTDTELSKMTALECTRQNENPVLSSSSDPNYIWVHFPLLFVWTSFMTFSFRRLRVFSISIVFPLLWSIPVRRLITVRRPSCESFLPQVGVAVIRNSIW